MPKNSNPSYRALSVIQGLATSLQLEPTFLAQFGERNLRWAQHIIKTVRNEPFKLSIANLVAEFVYRLDPGKKRMFFNFFSPGYDVLMTARKVMIAAKIEDAIDNKEVQQIVFLGGGYDPRAIFAAEKYKKINFFELDKGDTRDLKIKGLRTFAEMGEYRLNRYGTSDNSIVFNDNLHFIECDLLKDNLLDCLCNNGFNPTLKSLVIAEGLTMYIPPTTVSLMLSNLHKLLRVGDELVISFIPEKGTFSYTSLNLVLNSSNEPMQFKLEFDQVGRYMGEQGFSVKEKYTVTSARNLTTQRDFAARYNDDKKTPEPYFICQKSSTFLSKQPLAFDAIPEIKLDLTKKFCEEVSHRQEPLPYVHSAPKLITYQRDKSPTKPLKTQDHLPQPSTEKKRRKICCGIQ